MVRPQPKMPQLASFLLLYLPVAESVLLFGHSILPDLLRLLRLEAPPSHQLVERLLTLLSVEATFCHLPVEGHRLTLQLKLLSLLSLLSLELLLSELLLPLLMRLIGGEPSARQVVDERLLLLLRSEVLVVPAGVLGGLLLRELLAELLALLLKVEPRTIQPETGVELALALRQAGPSKRVARVKPARALGERRIEAAAILVEPFVVAALPFEESSPLESVPGIEAPAILIEALVIATLALGELCPL